MSKEQHALLMRGMGAFAIALVALLVAGTFADYQIAQAIYTPNNPLVILVSTLGLIPMAYPACLLFGVLAQRSLASSKSQVMRIAGAIVCAVCAVAFGGLATRAILSVRDGFAGLVGSELPTAIRMGVGALVSVVGFLVMLSLQKRLDR